MIHIRGSTGARSLNRPASDRLRSPPYHGVHDNLSMSLRPDVQTLAEVLRNEGFDTAAVRLHRDGDGYEQATRRLELYKVILPLGVDD